MSVPASQLIRLRPFASVITATQVRECRAAWSNNDGNLADEFVAGYLGHDDRSRHALDVALRALLSRGAGAAFFVNGVYGSGKSHLLGVLALLCEGAGAEAFGRAHPALAALPREFAPRLVVHFSLDDYGADVWSLEAAFWREVRAAWEATTGHEPTFVTEGLPRGEAFAGLEDALTEAGLNGLCVFIDEVSLFLSGRAVNELQRDAAFLQFLGERSRRAPLWVFAALQKGVEHINAYYSS